MSFRECEHPNCRGSETPATHETDMGWLCQGHYDCALEITRAERRMIAAEEAAKVQVWTEVVKICAYGMNGNCEPYTLACKDMKGIAQGRVDALADRYRRDGDLSIKPMNKEKTMASGRRTVWLNLYPDGECDGDCNPSQEEADFNAALLRQGPAVEVPLVLVDGKWQVDHSAARIAAFKEARALIAQEEAKNAAAESEEP